MYKAYNLELTGVPLYTGDTVQEFRARRNFESKSEKVISSLKNFLENGELSATAMSEEWFPDIEADIFLSHAHRDEAMAIKLAYMLEMKFGLKVFVDSMVWRNSDDLLSLLDKEYAYHSKNDTYNYRIRNQTTSHIHMLLATALQKMMDRCECTFFLNTPASLKTEDLRRTYTNSPWIYFELLQTSLLRRQIPKRLQGRVRLFSEGAAIEDVRARMPHVRYDIDIDHLQKLNSTTLVNWYNDCRTSPVSKGKDALDKLYQIPTT